MTDFQRELMHIAGNWGGYFFMGWYIVYKVGIIVAKFGGRAEAEAKGSLSMKMDAKKDDTPAEEKESDR